MLLRVVHASLRVRPIIHHFALALSFFIRPFGDALDRAFRSPCGDRSFVGYGFRLRVVLLSTAREPPRTSIGTRFRAFHVFVCSVFRLIPQVGLSGFQVCLFWNGVLLTLCVRTFLLCHMKSSLITENARESLLLRPVPLCVRITTAVRK